MKINSEILKDSHANYKPKSGFSREKNVFEIVVVVII